MSGRNPDIKEIYSRFFQVADKIFPELQFERYGGGWRSPRKLDGSEPHIKRKDKTVITNTVPNRLFEQGGENISFWDYIARRDGLAGNKNYEVYKRIYALAGYDLDQIVKDKDSPSQKEEPEEDNKNIPLYESLLEDVIGAWRNVDSKILEISNPAKAVMAYLKDNRGYSDEEIKQMELGYLPSQEGVLLSYKMRGQTEETFKRLGISSVGRNYQLAIPLRCKGILRGFAFRDINHSAESKNPKYLNNTGLKKTKYLFNFPVGKVDGDLILVEGELDALAATAKGVPNVAAIKGSSKLSEEQLELIKEANPKRVVLCLDDDEAGKAATEKLKEQLLSKGFPCAVATLPDGQDPDSYIREYGAEYLLKEVINKAENIQGKKIEGLNTSCAGIEELIERIVNRPDALVTGYASLDKEIRIPVGAITLVAGRPGDGKTTMLYNLLLSMAEEYPDKKFYFFTYEESEADLLLKILNRIIAKDFILEGKAHKYKDEKGNVPSNNLQFIESYLRAQHTNIPEIEEGKAKLDAYIKGNRIQVVDNFLKVEELAEIIRTANSRENIGAVFVDYVQKLPIDNPSADMRIKVMTISETFRKLAKDTKLPLIIGAQFNRKDNEDEKPTLGRLKEAANLEEDANLVLGLWRSLGGAGKEILVLKNRNGKSGVTINLNFKLHLGLIEDMHQLNQNQKSGVIGSY